MTVAIVVGVSRFDFPVSGWMQHPWACGPPEGTKIVVVVTPA